MTLPTAPVAFPFVPRALHLSFCCVGDVTFPLRYDVYSFYVYVVLIPVCYHFPLRPLRVTITLRCSLFVADLTVTFI